MMLSLARWLPATITCAMVAATIGCDGSETAVNGDGGSAVNGGAGGEGGSSGGMGGAPQGPSTGGSLGVGGFVPTPVHELPGLMSISFWERTGGDAPMEYEFDVNGPELTTRLDDPLATDNQDITGTPQEFYDVFYSDEDGVFDADGSYLTISGVFPLALPAGGGLNLAEIGLHYEDANVEFGNYVASYVVLGDNSAEANVDLCIDGDLQTHTTMGNTTMSMERLRLTLGFASTSGPPR